MPLLTELCAYLFQIWSTQLRHSSPSYTASIFCVSLSWTMATVEYLKTCGQRWPSKGMQIPGSSCRKQHFVQCLQKIWVSSPVLPQSLQARASRVAAAAIAATCQQQQAGQIAHASCCLLSTRPVLYGARYSQLPWHKTSGVTPAFLQPCKSLPRPDSQQCLPGSEQHWQAHLGVCLDWMLLQLAVRDMQRCCSWWRPASTATTWSSRIQPHERRGSRACWRCRSSTARLMTMQTLVRPSGMR